MSGCFVGITKSRRTRDAFALWQKHQPESSEYCGSYAITTSITGLSEQLEKPFDCWFCAGLGCGICSLLFSFSPSVFRLDQRSDARPCLSESSESDLLTCTTWLWYRAWQRESQVDPPARPVTTPRDDSSAWFCIGWHCTSGGESRSPEACDIWSWIIGKVLKWRCTVF